MKILHLDYHYIRNTPAPGPNCPPERLRGQIRRLLVDGYEILTCGEVRQRLSGGRPLPERHATLSFDDGLLDQWQTAMPILREFGVPATFFVITSALDGKMPPVIGFQIVLEKLGVAKVTEILRKFFIEYGLWSYARLFEDGKFDYSGMKMGEPEELRLVKAVFNHFMPPSLQAEFIRTIFEEYVKESMGSLVHRWFMSGEHLARMNHEGMEIAAHTVHHPWLNMIGESEVEAEARGADQRIKMITGLPTDSFAWTFGGAVRDEAQNAVARAGYRSAWNFWSAWKNLPEQPYASLFDIPRLHEQVFNP